MSDTQDPIENFKHATQSAARVLSAQTATPAKAGVWPRGVCRAHESTTNGFMPSPVYIPPPAVIGRIPAFAGMGRMGI